MRTVIKLIASVLIMTSATALPVMADASKDSVQQPRAVPTSQANRIGPSPATQGSSVVPVKPMITIPTRGPRSGHDVPSIDFVNTDLPPPATGGNWAAIGQIGVIIGDGANPIDNALLNADPGRQSEGRARPTTFEGLIFQNGLGNGSTE